MLCRPSSLRSLRPELDKEENLQDENHRVEEREYSAWY